MACWSISVPKGSTLGLKGGDVVLQIDGRKPSNTSQVHRILRSYDAGEHGQVRGPAEQEDVTVTGTIPSRARDEMEDSRPVTA